MAGAATLCLSLSLSAMALGAVAPAGAEPSSTATFASSAPGGVRTAASTESSAFARHLESKYVDPDRIYSSDVRWWLGEAAHTDETLLEEIQALYDAGFRGVELCMQTDNAPDADYAYGSEMWTHKWNLIMNKMLDLGMAVYLTSGTNWATSNVPGLDPASQAAMQGLIQGTTTIEAGQTLTSLPAPAANARQAGATFVNAYAYRVTNGTTVDPDSYVALPAATQGADVWERTLSWTPPSDGTWRVFSTWTQGTYETSSPAAVPSYTTNYFDTRGVDALKAFWEEHYLADPALRAKIEKGDVQLFMDSLEIEHGSGFTFWSEDMATEFQKRKGYDVRPYLFLISGVVSTFDLPYNSVATQGTYRLDGAEQRRQGIVNDFLDVQTQLYRERMLRPLKKWLNSVGIETRAQISYGKEVEMSEPIMDVDYPEAENLNQYNQVDVFRQWTGGSKLENKVLSSESSAGVPSYNATRQLHLRDAYSTYAAGFQRMIWHIWGAGFGYGNFQWPGYTAGRFGASTFHNLGSRNPGSRDYDEFNAHLGRVQQLMQTGKSRTDVGFISQKWVHGSQFRNGVGSDINQMNWQLAHQGIYYRSTELQDNGYTYDYFSPRFLFDDDVSFDTETKTIEKAGYQAIVLYQDWLDLDGAKRILSWAKKGLKVVVLEDAASRTPYNDGKDGALKKVTDELKTLDTVRVATIYDDIDIEKAVPGGYDDNVLEKLQELGVEPYTGYEEPNLQLLNQTREDADGNRYVYLYNYGDDEYHQYSHRPEIRNVKFGTNIKTDVEVDGRFVPYRIDAWTGEVTELADYRWENGRTVVPVDIDQNNIDLLAFEKVDAEQLHIVSTDAASAHAAGDGVAVRATESGEVTTRLSNGRTYTDSVTVPASRDITDWDLTVSSWRPSATAGDLVRTETIGDLTTTNRKTSTVTTDIEVQLEKLTTWDQIPEVGKAVSGTGHYEASFDWDADSASGAYLDLGDTLEESMEVWINGTKVGGHVSTNPTKLKMDVGGVGKPTIDDGTGTQVPLVGQDIYTGGVSWTKPVADVSDYLVDGENTIVIDYSSALANVQLDRGIVREGKNNRGFWKNDVKYLESGPRQAKLVPFVEKVYADPAATSVSAAAVRGTYGRATTVLATVAGTQPGGTVTVSRGATVLGRAAVTGGTARIALPGTALGAGTHTLTVAYGGDAANAASRTTTRAVIAQAPSRVRAVVAPKRPKAGTRPKVRVTVSVPGATATGRVAVLRGGKTIASGTVRSGKATIRLPRLVAGSRKLTIRYAGSANVAGSRKAIVVRVARR